MSVLADLGGDDCAELGGSNDVVEVVNVHDSGDRSAGGLEELEDAPPRLLQAGGVGRHAHVLHR